MKKVKKNLKKIRKWPEALPVILLLKVLFPIWVHFSHLGSFFPIWVYFSTLGPLFPIWVHFSHVGRFSHLTPSPMWALSQVGALPSGRSPIWAFPSGSDFPNWDPLVKCMSLFKRPRIRKIILKPSVGRLDIVHRAATTGPRRF